MLPVVPSMVVRGYANGEMSVCVLPFDASPLLLDLSQLRDDSSGSSSSDGIIGHAGGKEEDEMDMDGDARALTDSRRRRRRRREEGRRGEGGVEATESKEGETKTGAGRRGSRRRGRRGDGGGEDGRGGGRGRGGDPVTAIVSPDWFAVMWEDREGHVGQGESGESGDGRAQQQQQQQQQQPEGRAAREGQATTEQDRGGVNEEEEKKEGQEGEATAAVPVLTRLLFVGSASGSVDVLALSVFVPPTTNNPYTSSGAARRPPSPRTCVHHVWSCGGVHPGGVAGIVVGSTSESAVGDLPRADIAAFAASSLYGEDNGGDPRAHGGERGDRGGSFGGTGGGGGGWGSMLTAATVSEPVVATFGGGESLDGTVKDSIIYSV